MEHLVDAFPLSKLNISGKVTGPLNKLAAVKSVPYNNDEAASEAVAHKQRLRHPTQPTTK